jgi:hypothetical protein
MTKKRSEELYEQIYKAIQPIVHGETKNDVVEALGNAFWAILHAAGATPQESAKLVKSYTDHLLAAPWS